MIKNIRIHIITIYFLFQFISLLSAQKVKSGLEVLENMDFAPLKGKRVGLITNPTGVDRQLRSNIDIFVQSGACKLVALFGPEHGVRGDYAAGDYVSNFTDPVTGIPVFSIYGKTRKPTKEMLAGIDVLVYDIQDIGSRSYTYISTLGLAMEAAAENNIEFVVLDRPNPLGGLKMEGLITRPGFFSFVSQFPIPYVHGLTVGELAIYLNNEGLLAKGVHCKLQVIAMKGWKRKMTFQQTGLPWVPTSPHIPSDFSSEFYPVSGIVGELPGLSIGVGYTLPFQLFAAEWIDAEKLTASLNALHLPGMIFRPIHFSPFYAVFKGTMIHGVQVHFTDFKKANLTLTQFYVLQESHKLWPDKNIFEMCEPSRLNMFDKVCGSDTIRKTFVKTFTVESIENLWMQEVGPFREKAGKYFLYR
jgi:uncharacterized protein YbbC (DUF1343 family)